MCLSNYEKLRENAQNSVIGLFWRSALKLTQLWIYINFYREIILGTIAYILIG